MPTKQQSWGSNFYKHDFTNTIQTITNSAIILIIFFLAHHLLLTICPVKGHSVKYVLNSKI